MTLDFVVRFKKDFVDLLNLDSLVFRSIMVDRLLAGRMKPMELASLVGVTGTEELGVVEALLEAE